MPRPAQKYTSIPYQPLNYSEEEMLARSEAFYQYMQRRRSLRHFSTRSFPLEVLKRCIQSAGSAPSGAHKQPWSFCVVSDPALKKQIRTAAEKEEYTNYHGRMSERWLEDLAPLGTHWKKPFLEEAPYLVVVFKRAYEERGPQAEKQKNYYVNESVGLACGFFLVAVHKAGLVALTHTPSPMGFLSRILQRPENERPFLLIPVGYAAEKAKVPALRRKDLKEMAYFYPKKDTENERNAQKIP